MAQKLHFTADIPEIGKARMEINSDNRSFRIESNFGSFLTVCFGVSGNQSFLKYLINKLKKREDALNTISTPDIFNFEKTRENWINGAIAKLGEDKAETFVVAFKNLQPLELEQILNDQYLYGLLTKVFGAGYKKYVVEDFGDEAKATVDFVIPRFLPLLKQAA